MARSRLWAQPEPLDGGDAPALPPELQRVRVVLNGVADPRLRLHALPQGRQGQPRPSSGPSGPTPPYGDQRNGQCSRTSPGTTASEHPDTPSRPIVNPNPPETLLFPSSLREPAPATQRRRPSKPRGGGRPPHAQTPLGPIAISRTRSPSRRPHRPRVLRRRRDGRGKGRARLLRRDALTRGIDVVEPARTGSGSSSTWSSSTASTWPRSPPRSAPGCLRGGAADRLASRRRGPHPGRAADRLSELERARDLGGGRARARGEPPPDRRPQRLPGAGRRHRHEPDPDRARGRRGARATRPADPRRSPDCARGADGRPRQLRRDPLADRPRRCERLGEAGRRRGDDRRARPRRCDAAYRAVRQPVEGTMLTVIRELAEEAEAPRCRRRAGGAAASCSGAARTPSRGRPSCSTCCARRASSTRAAAGLLELVRGISAAARRRAAPRGAGRGGARGGHRRGPPGALALPLLHRLPGRGRGARRRRARGRARRARRLAARRRRRDARSRCTSTPTTRAGPLARHRDRDDRGRRDREHAPADATSARSGCSRRCPTRPTARPGRRGRRRRRQPAPVREPRRRRVVEGGQTMNPSTAEILDAIEATPATEVVVLPNNSNVILAAEQAAALVAKPVRVVPTRSIRRGSRRWSRIDAARSPPRRTPPRCARRSTRSRPAR